MEKLKLTKYIAKPHLWLITGWLTLLLTGCQQSRPSANSDIIFGSSSEESEDVLSESPTGLPTTSDAARAATDHLHGAAHIELKDTLIDMGDINKTKAPVASCEFVVKNTGNADLVISNVEAYCECTKAEFPQKPLAPGDKGVVKVTFNSRLVTSRSFEKFLQILSNAENGPQPITIKGTISY